LNLNLKFLVFIPLGLQPQKFIQNDTEFKQNECIDDKQNGLYISMK